MHLFYIESQLAFMFIYGHASFCHTLSQWSGGGDGDGNN